MPIDFQPVVVQNIRFIEENKKSQLSRPISIDLVDKKRLIATFASITKINTTSQPDTGKIPSSDGQKKLASVLAKNLITLGLKNVNIDKNYMVSAELPSNLNYSVPKIALLAHMDTSNATSGENVMPTIHHYSSGDIKLKGDTVIKADELQKFRGEEVITSDGTTLLGGDDKAGIAEILEALMIYKQHPELNHPTIKIAFTPDEEIGGYIDKFDIKKFGADFAYTVDGEEVEKVDIATFCAYNVDVKIKGISTHTGDGYKKMINSTKLAAEIITALPKEESPEETRGLDGFYHVKSINGNLAETELKLQIRDFNEDTIKARIKNIEKIAAQLQEKNKGSEIQVKSKFYFPNMEQYLLEKPEIIDNTLEGIRRTGLVPVKNHARGGTDGGDLSKRGLPCPNLGTGGYNLHANKEFVVVKQMQQSVANILNIMSVWAEKSKKD